MTHTYLDELKELADLHKNGILTDAEFERKKKEILSFKYNKKIDFISFLYFPIRFIRKAFLAIFSFLRDVTILYFKSLTKPLLLNGQINRNDYCKTLFGMALFVPIISTILLFYMKIEIPFFLAYSLLFVFISLSILQLQSTIIKRFYDFNKTGVVLLTITTSVILFNFISFLKNYNYHDFFISETYDILNIQIKNISKFFFLLLLFSFIFLKKSSDEKKKDYTANKIIFYIGVACLLFYNFIFSYMANTDFFEFSPPHRIKMQARLGLLNFHTPDRDGTFFLDRLICYGFDSSVIKEFITHGASTNQANKNSGNTPLLRASLLGKTSIVKMLLENGTDVNQANNIGFTPLMGAVKSGDCSIIRMLLEKGADANAKLKDYAKDGIRKLTGGDSDLRDFNDPKYPYAIYNVKNACSAKLLIKYGAVVPKDIFSSLKFISSYSYNIFGSHYSQNEVLEIKELLELFVKTKKDINYKDDKGNTVLHQLVSIKQESLDAINVLLSNGANINAQNNAGMTPLMMVNRFNEKMALRLLKAGAKVNLRDKEGKTALMHHSNPKIIGDIIYYGGKLNTVDNNEISAVEHISENVDSFHYNEKNEPDYIKWKSDFMKKIDELYKLEIKHL